MMSFGRTVAASRCDKRNNAFRCHWFWLAEAERILEPAPPLPNCTAADLAGVAAGVAASTRRRVFAHPDVNDYFTSLKGTPRSEMRGKLQQYMDANPQVHADLQGIRQPIIDFRARCQGGRESGENDDLLQAVFVGRENPAGHFFCVLRCSTA